MPYLCIYLFIKPPSLDEYSFMNHHQQYRWHGSKLTHSGCWGLPQGKSYLEDSSNIPLRCSVVCANIRYFGRIRNVSCNPIHTNLEENPIKAYEIHLNMPRIVLLCTRHAFPPVMHVILPTLTHLCEWPFLSLQDALGLSGLSGTFILAAEEPNTVLGYKEDLQEYA